VREILQQAIFGSKFLSDMGPNRAVIQRIPGRVRSAAAISLQFPRWIIQASPHPHILMKEITRPTICSRNLKEGPYRVDFDAVDVGDDGMSRLMRIPTHRGQDSERSRTAFRRIADKIPNDRGQRSDDRGQWWMIG
jgi:hypothetical protein